MKSKVYLDQSKTKALPTLSLSDSVCVCLSPYLSLSLSLSLSLLRLIHNSVLDSYLVGAIGFCVAFLGLQWKRVHEQCAICNWIVQQNFTERSERKKERKHQEENDSTTTKKNLQIVLL